MRGPVNLKALPARIDVEITNACNFNCSVCSTGNRRLNRPKAHLNPNRFREILAKIDHSRLDSVNINCIGEPFINPHIYEILTMVDGIGKRVSIPTNASLIDPQHLKQLSSNISYTVSLDGVDYATFNGYRHTTEDNFKKVIRILREMADLGINFSLVSLVSRHNQNHLDEIQAFADELGVPVKFKPIICSPYGVTQEMLPKGVKETDNWVGRRYVAPKDYANLAQTGKRVESRTKYLFDKDLNLYVNPDTFVICPYIFSSWICADGTVIPCCFEAYYNTVNFGNIFEASSFNQIWLSRTYLDFRRGMMDVSRSSHGPCRICTKG